MLVTTAGHVDHGKSSLVQQLTGVDTDRLEEEKQRGLSIELGFAFCPAGASGTIGFIDVPGHHRFINTMISGISSIDLAMLVVAADDGLMPQTLEHVQLLRLLGVEHFLGIISKIDLVDSARVDQVATDIEKLIPGATLCAISNRTGEGIDQLVDILQQRAKDSPPRQTEQQFRMYIDRVFVKKGTGLVVTGTSLSGSITVGDQLRLFTTASGNLREFAVRVRDIHSQGSTAEIGHVGQRCALNLVGKVSHDQVNRGDFLCANPNTLPSLRLDAVYFPNEDAERALKHLDRAKLYIGTRRMSARIYFLDRSESSNAGNLSTSQRVQMILEKDVVSFAGDRFIIRDDSEQTTLGGGIVIDPEAPKWGKSKSNRLNHLSALEQNDPRSAIRQLLFTNGEPVSLNRCKRIWNLTDTELDSILGTESLGEENVARITMNADQLIVSRQLWNQYCSGMQQALGDWHTSRPMESGIKVDQLRKLLQNSVPEQLYSAVLESLIGGGQIIMNENRLHALGHRPTISAQVQKDWRRLVRYMTQRGLNLPLRSEIQKDIDMDPKLMNELTRPALKSKDIYEIGEKRLALPETLRALARLLEEHCENNNGFTVIEAKQIFGLGRNLTIEILEFFDKIGYTKRNGDLRTVENADAIVNC